MWRHGDVFIAAVKSIPGDARMRPQPVLAYGELTGHSHRIEDPDAAQMYESGATLFLDIKADSATVVHQEHKPITLPRGFYRVWQQREYAPRELRMFRTVAD